MAENQIPAELIERAEAAGVTVEEIVATACCASCPTPLACWQGAPCRLERPAARLHDAMPEARRP